MKKQFSLTANALALALSLIFFFSACSTEAIEKTIETNTNSNTNTSTNTETVADVYDTDKSSIEIDLDSFVSSKYSNQNNDTWGCHDPKLFQDDDGTYYVYSTGWAGGVQLRSSKDLVNWKTENFSITEWDSEFQSWVATNQSWAPTVVKQNGKYYMFHGIITGDAPNVHACITLAISDSPTGNFRPAKNYDSASYKTSTLVRYTWDNSVTGFNNTYNTAGRNWYTGFGCIDPEFVFDIATGKLMEYTIGTNKCYAVTYGSWKGGIAVIYVDAETFKPVCTVQGTSLYDSKKYAVGDEMDAPADSISGNQGTFLVGRKPGFASDSAYEGAQLIYNSTTGYYYIFVSMGELTYEYRVGVGRAKSENGLIPTEYFDANGGNMSAVSNRTYHAIGGKIMGAAQLTGEYGWRSPGGQSILRSNDGKIFFACHSRTTFMGGAFVLRIHQMFFNEDGWPLLNQNDFYDDYSGLTDSGSEELSEVTLAKIAGTYKTVMTERGSETSTLNLAGQTYEGNTADGNATASKKMIISEDGRISGRYTGNVTLASDGYTATITLDNIGTFKGFFLHAVDWAKKSGARRTITFTTIDSSKSGEYFWGNKYISQNE